MFRKAPKYLCDLLRKKENVRNLRSSEDSTLLQEHKYNSKTLGGRAFSIYGPKLWNAIPKSIREIDDLGHFKKELKTHVFRSVYNHQ